MIEGLDDRMTKRVDGTWKFDYDIFDQYVQVAIEAGINKAIHHLYSGSLGPQIPLPRC